MNQSLYNSFSQIQLELAQLNFDRNAISSLTSLINQSILLTKTKIHPPKCQEIIGRLNYLLEQLKEIYTYREEQQISIFDQLVEALTEILNEFS
jgi:hypothetical protein